MFGYGAMSARQGSARAGVAQSSFYAHFKDKEDLVRTLADEIFSRLRRQLRESRRGEGLDWDGILTQTVMRIYDFFLSEKELVALLFQELDQPGSPISEIGHQIFDTLHLDLEEDLTQLVQEGRIPPIPVSATVHLVVGTATYILRRLLAGKLPDPMPLFAEFGVMNRAMLRGLTGAGDEEPQG